MTSPPIAPIVLGLDAATPPSSVALVRGKDLLASIIGPFGPQTDAWILEAIDSALEHAGISLEQVDRIASSIGPGTFTGIRVGIATAAGLARGAGVPGVGINTLEALVESALMASDGVPDTVLAVVDARRGQLYAALSADGIYRTRTAFEWGPVLLTPAELVERLGDSAPLAAGPGAAAYDDVVAATRPIETAPLAVAVARLAAADVNTLPALHPFYIRPADAVVGPSPLRDKARQPHEVGPGDAERGED